MGLFRNWDQSMSRQQMCQMHLFSPSHNKNHIRSKHSHNNIYKLKDKGLKVVPSITPQHHYILGEFGPVSQNFFSISQLLNLAQLQQSTAGKTDNSKFFCMVTNPTAGRMAQQQAASQHRAKEGQESIPTRAQRGRERAILGLMPFWPVLLEVLPFCGRQNNVISVVTDRQLLRFPSKQNQNK